MTGARIFVAIVYVVLGAAFLASTGLLIVEFQELDWLTMLVAYSHLFLFFPVFGLLALVAFYLPSVVLTHLYWTHLPYEVLARISTRIINEVKGVNRVAYDISSKPPATIEWE